MTKAKQGNVFPAPHAYSDSSLNLQRPAILPETTSIHLDKASSLRLLMVTPRYFPYIGGVETHVYEVARRLARIGVDVTILTADPGGRLPVDEQAEGIHIRRVRAWPAQRDYYFAPAIARIIRQGDWNVVHVQSYHTLVAPLAMLAAWQAKLPYVVTFHGGGHSSALRHRLRGVQQLLLRPLLAQAHRLVALARFEIDEYSQRLQLPAARFVWIPNGSDLASVERPANLTREAGLLASVGRLERYKGHHRMIAALPYILEKVPTARLWIAGQGPDEAKLRQLAARLGVADRVEIRAIPPTERANMAAALAKVALVTLLSDYETHPIAALEALALGCPVLVTDTSGLRELATAGLARMVPLVSTPPQVAAAVVAALHQPLSPTTLQLPTWDACAHKLWLLYQECMVREGNK